MTLSDSTRAPWTTVVRSRDLQARLAGALGTHAPWIVVVRETVPEDLSDVLNKGADADVITISKRASTARIRPDAVCWRRDTLASVLAGESSIPATFRMIWRAQRKGARVLDLASEPVERAAFGPLWADPIHQ